VEYFVYAILGVLGYTGAHFIAKPLLELRKTRTDILRTLVLYANVDALASIADVQVNDARAQEARGIYRELASTLIAQANSIPFYAVWSLLGVVPKFKDIEKVRANLIGLSNSIGVKGQSLDNSRRQTNIEQALRFKT
jgi:hypothetical protein